MNSALYFGRLQHHRFTPRPHRFSLKLYMAYLDLDELATVFEGRWFWSLERRNLASFRRRDYYGDPTRSLAECVRDRVEERLGARPEGPIRILTHLATFGYCFNPVSFYYCFEADGRTPVAIMAEITNTPWGERHTYVLGVDGAQGGRRILSWDFPKSFHVSPFFDMEQTYRWSFSRPEERLSVAMENHEAGRRVFAAHLALQRRPIGGRTLAAALVRHPMMALTVHGAIYLHALALWMKRAPFFAHPDRREGALSRTS